MYVARMLQQQRALASSATMSRALLKQVAPFASSSTSVITSRSLQQQRALASSTVSRAWLRQISHPPLGVMAPSAGSKSGIASRMLQQQRALASSTTSRALFRQALGPARVMAPTTVLSSLACPVPNNILKTNRLSTLAKKTQGGGSNNNNNNQFGWWIRFLTVGMLGFCGIGLMEANRLQEENNKKLDKLEESNRELAEASERLADAVEQSKKTFW